MDCCPPSPSACIANCSMYIALLTVLHACCGMTPSHGGAQVGCLSPELISLYCQEKLLHCPGYSPKLSMKDQQLLLLAMRLGLHVRATVEGLTSSCSCCIPAPFRQLLP